MPGTRLPGTGGRGRSRSGCRTQACSGSPGLMLRQRMGAALQQQQAPPASSGPPSDAGHLRNASKPKIYLYRTSFIQRTQLPCGCSWCESHACAGNLLHKHTQLPWPMQAAHEFTTHCQATGVLGPLRDAHRCCTPGRKGLPPLTASCAVELFPGQQCLNLQEPHLCQPGRHPLARSRARSWTRQGWCSQTCKEWGVVAWRHR